jgi:hypothetical protein
MFFLMRSSSVKRPSFILLSYEIASNFCLADDLILTGRNDDIVDAPCGAGIRGVIKAECLYLVENGRNSRNCHAISDEIVYNAAESLLY